MKKSLGLKGQYVIRKGKSPDNMEIVAEFDNLITDLGLNNFTMRSVVSVCYIGTGNSVPIPSQTTLDSTIASISVPTSSLGVTYTAGTEPYLRTGWRCRFNPGVGTGNIAEIGIGWNTGTSPNFTQNLFSRALVRDNSGNPTTITKLADEYLDVVYYVRVYPDVSDVIQETVYKGEDVTVLSRVSSVNTWNIDRILQSGLEAANSSGTLMNGTSVIGGITGAPSPNNPATGSSTLMSYVTKPSGQYYRQAILEYGITTTTSDNLVGCERLVLWAGSLSGAMAFQASFTPPLAKDNTEKLTMTWNISWGRKD